MNFQDVQDEMNFMIFAEDFSDVDKILMRFKGV